MQDINLNPGGIETPEAIKATRWNLGTFQGTVAIPATFLPSPYPPQYYQNGQPACGGFAGTKLQNVLLGDAKVLSPRFLFAMCKKIDGLPPDSGTYMNAIFKALKDYGVCMDAFFPNDISLNHADYADWSKIAPSAYSEAATRKIATYAFLQDITMDALKQAIFQNKAVIVLKAPWTPASWYPLPSNSGHFFVLDGYDETRLRFTNSFGADWMDHGEGWLKAEDIVSIKEAGTVVEATSPHFTHNFLVDMKLDQTSQEIAALQQALRIDGEFTNPQNTGYYGPITQQAVHAFQAKYGIPDSGTNGSIVGPKTRAQLNILFSK